MSTSKGCLRFWKTTIFFVAVLPALSRGSPKVYSDKLACSSPIRKFDPLKHKQKYVVAAHSIRGFEETVRMYNLTFGEYLTATAGQRFDPPIEFEMIPTTFEDLYEPIIAEEVDFFYANPAIYSCVGTELGAQPLATIISKTEVRGHVYDLDVFGGVIFTKADNDEINSITDLEGKIIGTGSIAQVMAPQLQFYQMQQAGMSYIMDPKQVVFMFNQDLVVKAVLSGEIDVGMIKTDIIERTVDENGKSIDPDLFKIIEPKIYVLDDGNLFPFLHSTPVYPEWLLSAATHVPKDISEEVQEALLALENHIAVAEALEGCQIDVCQDFPCTTTKKEDCDIAALPEDIDVAKRCDSTKELAGLALKAARAAAIAGFRTTRSYFELRTMQEAAGFILKDEKGNWKCTRADTLYDSIQCPPEHYKLSKAAFGESCRNIGLSCKEGFECYCKPCVKAFQVDVYEYKKDTVGAQQGCGKMSLCGSVQQTKVITFRAYDNKERRGAEVKVKVHLGQTTEELVVHPVANASSTYEFSWSNDHLGVGIMEVFINGEQIPQSPIRVQVVERDCDVDYHGQGKEADENGSCICDSGSIDLGGKCLSSTIFAVIISIAVLIFATIVGIFYIRFKKKQNDQMWIVSVEELHFNDPVDVIGQGSFGVVLLAEYRGTKVAIKRALPSVNGSKKGSRGSRGSRGGGTGSKNSSNHGSAKGGSVASNATPDSFSDPEAQSGGRGANSNDVLAGEKSGRSSENFSLGFLGEDFGEISKWAWLCPCFAHENEQSRFKQSILGNSNNSMSKKSLITVLLPCLDKQARQREEFVVEMRLLSRLRHPCITTVMGAVISNMHDPMLVMEYMEYGSLHDLLRNDTMYLTGEIIMQIVRDIAQGMRYLHSSRPPILHGDMKARNILIDSRFRAKVCDFGLSTKKKNGVSGTPYWLAPEYLRGKTDYTACCDIYSIGIILYEIYSRENPYPGENFKEVLRKVCDRRINKRPAIPESCPPKMVDLMKKCWSPDPFFRPQAKDLDMTLMEMSIQDAEPIDKGQDTRKTERPTTDMLEEMFPKHIAEALKNGQKVEPENHELVTVVFSDIVHFTDISRTISPLQVSNMLDRLYLAFDTIARKHKVFKVETIGDAYMGVTNLEADQEDTHVKSMAEFALDMVEEASKILIDAEDPEKGFVHIRVGFHSGPVVSNVIGSLNPRYGLFGDTINTASSMESNSIGSRVLCSERSANLLREQAPEIPVTKRGKIQVKGKGDMTVYWVGDGLPQTNDVYASKEKQITFAEDM